MTTLTVAAGSTKFALLSQFARRQSTAAHAATEAGVSGADFKRRTRELLAAGLVEDSGKSLDGLRVLRITANGRAVCRALKAKTR